MRRLRDWLRRALGARQAGLLAAAVALLPWCASDPAREVVERAVRS